MKKRFIRLPTKEMKPGTKEVFQCSDEVPSKTINFRKKSVMKAAIDSSRLSGCIR